MRSELRWGVLGVGCLCLPLIAQAQTTGAAGASAAEEGGGYAFNDGITGGRKSPDGSVCEAREAVAVDIETLTAAPAAYYGRCVRVAGFISLLNRKLSAAPYRASVAAEAPHVGVYFPSNMFGPVLQRQGSLRRGGLITLVGLVGDCRDHEPLPEGTVMVDGPYCATRRSGPYIAINRFYLPPDRDGLP